VPNRERGFWFSVGAAGLALAGLTAGLIVAFTAGGSPAPVARARSYASLQACLLTGERGVADPAAAPVWAGMQKASLATRAMVSYLAVTGPQTEGNALPFLGSLLARNCELVLAAGQAAGNAVAAQARQYPTVQFAVVDGTVAAPNVTVLSGSAAAVRAGAASAVSRAAGN
jgi:basic membrane lipoprotein Med (substrate-binding protein (PBP1-ABC) superfamily)